MRRRDFICGLSCLIAGMGFNELYNRNLINFDNKKSDNNNIERHELWGFTVAVSSHCNLNCKGCDTYSPLAKKEFVTIEQFSKDMEKLKKLAPEREQGLGFLGGEPLLNPDLLLLIKKAHELFPNSENIILTNGILLNKMDNNFWKTLHENNVKLAITTYPLNIDRSIYEKKAAKYNVKLQYDKLKTNKLYDLNTKEVIGTYVQDGFDWSKNILDLSGKQNYIEKRKSCPHKGIVQYARGNIYYCYVHAFINAFIDYFKVDIPITKDDYIKISDVKDIKEIDDFLSTPKPLCKYCKQCHNTCYGGKPLEWEFSKHEITEWT